VRRFAPRIGPADWRTALRAPPKAGLKIGLRDSVAVILSNLAMDEGRRVYYNEIDKMGCGEVKAGKGRQTD
jgi:hypothetical protein